MRHLVLLLLLVSYSFANGQCTSTNTLITYYASNNGQRGAMFNITATNTVTINCFDASLYTGSTADYEIYYRTGTYVGSENNAGAWTLIGTTTGLTSAGANVGTPIPILVNVTIPAGQTYGFYITNTFGGGLSYTDGTAATNLLGSDANISINGGVGKSYPFGLTFSFREFNGAVHYTPGVPLPIELGGFWVNTDDRKTELSWETYSELNNDYFTIEKSVNGSDFEFLAQVDAVGNSQKTEKYTFEDVALTSDVAYYRLSQTDLDGATTYFEVRAAKKIEDQPTSLHAVPNPTNGTTIITGSKDELGDLVISDVFGRTITAQIPSTVENNRVILDFSDFENSLFFVRIGDESITISTSR